MGVTWAVAGSGVGSVLARLMGVNTDLPIGFLLAPLGFSLGVVFSGILVVAGRRGLARLSLARFAAWGALSGVVMCGIIVGVAALRGENLLGAAMMLGPVVAGASAACAAGSLAIARRAERRELGDAGSDQAATGLGDGEKSRSAD
ncbi:MAG TPA: hypothetical protein VF483_03455 [Gemmatimonadaceae bacterium]